MPINLEVPTRPRRPAMVLPSWSDPVARLASRAIGGQRGRRGSTPQQRVVMGAAIVVATLTWLVGIVQKVPCRYDKAGESVDWFAWMCYSDIPLLYRYRGLADGYSPYFVPPDQYQVLEYPVLTGFLLEIERLLTVATGAPVGPGLTEQQTLDAAIRFFDINQVVLYLCFLVLVVVQVHTTAGRPWDAIMVAASPAVVLTGLINWDLFAVALTAVGCYLWARRMPLVAGVLLGLATAAKLYPLFLLGPLILLCVRTGKLEALLRTVGGFVVGWAVVNVPVMALAPRQWLEFWTFNADRGGDLGSIWYVYSLITGSDVPGLNVVNMVLLVLGCGGIAVLAMAAPRRPRFAQLAYLVVFVFLVTNKVYSPQYVLWLLPLMVLARPRWQDWIVFNVGEICYVLAIWGHLGQFTTAGGGGDRLYWIAVVLRIGCEAWVAAQIVLDVLRPERDPVRQGWDPRTERPLDDPSGGVLDGAPDAPWFRRFWNGVAVGGHP